MVEMSFHSAWCAVIWVCGINQYSVTLLRNQMIGLINESVNFLGRMQGARSLIELKLKIKLSLQYI